MNFLSTTGTGLQIGSIGSAFATVVAGVPLAPVAAVCGAGFIAGSLLKMD